MKKPTQIQGMAFASKRLKTACRNLAVVAVCLLTLIIGPACERTESIVRPNLILISIDTLRADHLGCMGYFRPTSPFLDSLAESAGTVLFEQCIAQASTTAPSHMSIFTSLHPTCHGVPNIPPGKGVGRLTLPAQTKTVAQYLKEAGYRTAGIADGGYLEPVFGFKRGFETYQCKYEGAAKKVDQAIAWLERAAGLEDPFFLFLHTYEVHAPYLAPEPFRDLFTNGYVGWIKDYCEQVESSEEMSLHLFADLFKRRGEFTSEDVDYLISLYDAEIAYTDHELKRLWSALERLRLLEHTVVVIVSDHGEEFGDHGEFSHKNLYDDVVRVPLFIMLPPALQAGVARQRIPEQVSLIDVLPTLLDLLDLPVPAYMQGRSLQPLIEQREASAEQPAFSTYIDFSEEPICQSVRLEGAKLLSYPAVKHFEFFDLANDKRELLNLAGERKDQGKALLERLNAQHDRNLELRGLFKAVPAQGEIDPDVMDALRQLGY